MPDAGPRVKVQCSSPPQTLPEMIGNARDFPRPVQGASGCLGGGSGVLVWRGGGRRRPRKRRNRDPVVTALICRSNTWAWDPRTEKKTEAPGVRLTRRKKNVKANQYTNARGKTRPSLWDCGFVGARTMHSAPQLKANAVSPGTATSARTAAQYQVVVERPDSRKGRGSEPAPEEATVPLTGKYDQWENVPFGGLIPSQVRCNIQGHAVDATCRGTPAVAPNSRVGEDLPKASSDLKNQPNGEQREIQTPSAAPSQSACSFCVFFDEGGCAVCAKYGSSKGEPSKAVEPEQPSVPTELDMDAVDPAMATDRMPLRESEDSDNGSSCPLCPPSSFCRITRAQCETSTEPLFHGPFDEDFAPLARIQLDSTWDPLPPPRYAPLRTKFVAEGTVIDTVDHGSFDVSTMPFRPSPAPLPDTHERFEPPTTSLLAPAPFNGLVDLCGWCHRHRDMVYPVDYCFFHASLLQPIDVVPLLGVRFPSLAIEEFPERPKHIVIRPLVDKVSDFRYYQKVLEIAERYIFDKRRTRYPIPISLRHCYAAGDFKWTIEEPGITGEDAGGPRRCWIYLGSRFSALANEAYNRAKQCSNDIFKLIASYYGLEVRTDTQWDKKSIDLAMESYFGSLAKPGEGLFSYPGVQKLGSGDEPVMFSLYLCRKALNVSRAKDMEKALQSFHERMEAPHNPRSPELKQKLTTLVSRICDVLFDPSLNHNARPVLSVPNSNKSCVEWTSFEGGKRVGLANVPWTTATGVVRPKAIISAGKIRVITIDSIRSQRYNDFNERALNALRGLPWVLSGRELRDVLSIPSCKVRAVDGKNIISGDLEAATDTFATELSEAYLERLCFHFCHDDETPEDAFEYLAGVTTRAKFYQPGNGKVESGHACECEDGCPRWCRNAWVEVASQQRGQLMGSIVSFPGLCVVNAVTAFHARGLTDEMLQMSKEELLRCLREDHGFLVNGDDLIAPMNLEEQSRWELAVDSIGGIVSRGKTLSNPTFGTVNSELVDFSDGGARVVDVLRPTLIAGLHDRSYKAPQAVWNEYLRASERWPLFAGQFDTERTLFPSMPRGWGGFGSRRLGTFEEFRLRLSSVLALKTFRPKVQYDWVSGDHLNISYVSDHRGQKQHCSASVLNPDFVPPQPPLPPPQDRLYREGYVAPPGWYTKTSVREFAAARYGRDRAKMRWMEETSTRLDFYQVWKSATEQASFTTEREARALFDEYNEQWDNDECGNVYLNPTPDPWGFLRLQEPTSMMRSRLYAFGR